MSLFRLAGQVRAEQSVSKWETMEKARMPPRSNAVTRAGKTKGTKSTCGVVLSELEQIMPADCTGEAVPTAKAAEVVRIVSVWNPLAVGAGAVVAELHLGAGADSAGVPEVELARRGAHDAQEVLPRRNFPMQQHLQVEAFGIRAIVRVAG